MEKPYDLLLYDMISVERCAVTVIYSCIYYGSISFVKQVVIVVLSLFADWNSCSGAAAPSDLGLAQDLGEVLAHLLDVRYAAEKESR